MDGCFEVVDMQCLENFLANISEFCKKIVFLRRMFCSGHGWAPGPGADELVRRRQPTGNRKWVKAKHCNFPQEQFFPIYHLFLLFQLGIYINFIEF